jgi:UrcA family protein
MEIAMKTSSLLAACAALFMVTPVWAQTATDAGGAEVRVSVPHADLDLVSAAGRARLEARIRHVVADTCGQASPADLRGVNEVRRCRSDALRLATAQAERVLASAGRPPAAVAALGE